MSVEQISERYHLDTELGRGGMGIVYRARDRLLDRQVALKVLSNGTLGTEGRARLLEEARAAAQLNHPNIVSVYDVGETAGKPYIVMELVEGKTLREQKPETIGKSHPAEKIYARGVRRPAGRDVRTGTDHRRVFAGDSQRDRGKPIFH